MNRNGIPIFLMLCLSTLAAADLYTVSEDAPGRLRFDITLPQTVLVPQTSQLPRTAADGADEAGGTNGGGGRDGGDGLRLTCVSCNGSAPGSPDLPVFSANILTGPDAPVVSVEILESETRLVPEGIAPVPTAMTPNHSEYRRDEAAYADASALKARVGPVRFLRGFRVRGIQVPLALWSQAGNTLTLLKRLRVTVAFPDAQARPNPWVLRGTFRAEVLNPIGGDYLPGPFPNMPATGSSPTSAKKSATSYARAMGKRSVVSGLGESLIRIRVGDRDPGSFAEDKVYALAFSDAVKTAPGLNGVLIRNLRLYTGPEDTLPRVATGAAVGATLAEVPLEIRDADADHVFDAGDTLFFYGHGTSIWKHLPASVGPVRWRFSSDPYSFENYYFLDYSAPADGTAPALRLAASASPASWAPLPSRTSAYQYLRAERDVKALTCEHAASPPTDDSATGVLWFWHWSGSCAEGAKAVILNASQMADAETEFLKDALRAPGDSLLVGMFAYPYRQSDDFRIRLAGSTDAMTSLGKADGLGAWYAATDPLPADGRLHIDSIFWGGTDRRLEGYTVAYRRKLALAAAPLWIFPEAFGTPAAYRVEGGQGATCLRIENGVPTRKMILDGQGGFSDSVGDAASVRYLLFRNAAPVAQTALDVDEPSLAGKGLRNLGTGDGKDPEYLLIAPRALAEQAVALKRYREDGKRALPLKTQVVFVEDIYRAFSGGRMSPPAIRDFLRWAYGNWGGQGPAGQGPGANPLKYVLLMGSGHFDYRNLTASQMRGATPNFIPPYEFFSDSNNPDGLASDDFYGLLDSGEQVGDGAIMELSVGRLPARSAAEAQDYLRKVGEYEDPALAGAWRGRMAFAADDATQRGRDHDFDPIPQGHTTATDSISRAVTRNEPGVTADKVYLLDYPFDPAFHKPQASQDLLALINQGTLMVTYVGHGSNNQWADEVLLQTNDGLSRMDNRGRTPIINAFACTVGRFESLKQDAMSDRLVMARDKGAIAAVSATRESYPNENRDLAIAFYKRAFPPELPPALRQGADPIAPGATAATPSPAGYAPIGDALREAKNSNDYFKRNLNDSRYALLGEPVLLARKPALGISFTKAPDTLKALDCSTLEGTVTGGSGSGSVNVKILGASSQKEWPGPKGSSIQTQYAEIHGAILFEQTFPYKDGRFSAEYFIPKKVPFGDSGARIVAFAWDATEEREGSTAKDSLRIQGIQSGGDGACAQDLDGKGPRISITGCDPKETGGLDFPDRVSLPLPSCLEIQVEDSTGGVLSSENPDEGTTLQIPGILNAFHPHPGIDGLYRKVYRFPMEPAAIPPGIRMLKVSARDGYGNVSQRSLTMDLTLDSSLAAVAAYNVPNPMKRGATRFYFSTAMSARSVDFSDPGLAQDRIEFGIRVFDQMGRLVKVIDRARSGESAWDGRDAWGNLMANGVYYYKVTARQNLMDAGEKPDYRTLSSKRNVLVISR